jgi:hypothetical protein
LGALLGSVGHTVKIQIITPATGEERVDIEIKNFVVLQKAQEQVNRLVQMVLLSLMLLCRQWSGIKYDIIAKFDSVV